MSNQSTIYQIRPQELLDNDILNNYIYPNMENNYYWSDDWSSQFYIDLAYAGFITTTYKTQDSILLLPEIQYEYAVLDFENLHISKKVKKLLNKNLYKFNTNEDIDNLISKINTYHKESWLSVEYIELLKSLYSKENQNFEIMAISLSDDNNIIAGEIGYKIGKTYTSLSGFCTKEKKYNNVGTLQMVLLSKYLETNDFDFWNMGHPYMDYKKKLGAKIYSREDFLNRWFYSRDL